MPGPGSVACPKPVRGSMRKAKDSADRRAAKYAAHIRTLVSMRDGDCRLQGVTSCSGESEWAHLEDKRRWNTRKAEPWVRHTTAGTAMLCTGHHAQYDQHRIVILSLGALGADGDLVWDVPGYGVYAETGAVTKERQG